MVNVGNRNQNLSMNVTESDTSTNYAIRPQLLCWAGLQSERIGLSYNGIVLGTGLTDEHVDLQPIQHVSLNYVGLVCSLNE